MSSAHIQKALFIPRPISQLKLYRYQTLSKRIGSRNTLTCRLSADHTDEGRGSQEHPFQGSSSNTTRTTKYTFEVYTLETKYEHSEPAGESLEIGKKGYSFPNEGCLWVNHHSRRPSLGNDSRSDCMQDSFDTCPAHKYLV